VCYQISIGHRKIRSIHYLHRPHPPVRGYSSHHYKERIVTHREFVMDQDDYLSLCLAAALVAASQQAAGDAPPLRARAAASELRPLHFRCPICGKAFASYQALGGHKASHRKPAAAAAAYDGKAPSSPSSSGQHQKGAVAAGIGGASAGGRHVCTVCHRYFATGQALGGHKRFHYLHGPSVPASSLPPSTAGAAAGVGWLDLNLTPLAPDVSFAGVRRRRGEDDEVQSPLPLPAKKHRASTSA
jgi:hypothetical protein